MLSQPEGNFDYESTSKQVISKQSKFTIHTEFEITDYITDDKT